ncbi:SMP-30/gluconolactonase/LRE family protein [Ferrovibrio sp.]|uniref:SMP-30/gluconolactonase/LRE family protein n=1 Tax=Ferrovibrio sp. TaxID=1917215 RepID=UPI003D1354FD
MKQLSLHARLPRNFRSILTNGWAERRRNGAAADCFLEGPCCDDRGWLWCVDIANSRILLLSPDGAWGVAYQYDGWPTGLKLDRQNRCLIADNRWGLLRLDPAIGKHEVLANSFEGAPLHGPNDVTIAANGDVYFTDQGDSDILRPYGRVFRWREGRELELIATGFPSPNGLVLTPDERLLYVAVTQANAIWRVILRPDGGVGKVGHFVQMSGSLGGGPDGLAMDAAGNLLVCHAMAGCVIAYDRLGEFIGRIRTAEGLIPTNLAFSRREPGRLFVTEAETGTVQTIRLDHPGHHPFVSE